MMKSMRTHALFVLLVSTFFYNCRENTPFISNTKLKKSIPYDSIQNVLEIVYDKDQEIRIQLSNVRPNSYEFKELVHKMQTIDKTNLESVLSIVEKYGWLKKSNIGEKASEAIFLTIQHSSKKNMEKFLPALKELALKNEASLINACMMEDRLLMRNGEKQKYGTQISTKTRSSGRKVVWPIENPNKVDSIRKSMGFKMTVKEYADKMGAIYNSEESLPNEVN